MNAPHEADLDLGQLQRLADEYFVLPEAGDVELLDAWFRLFERYPDSDGYGVFWTILHGIEHVVTSPTELLTIVRRSLDRKPSYFPAMMIHRMLNSPAFASQPGERVLLNLLRQSETDQRCNPELRVSIRGFLEYQLEQGRS